MVTTRMHDDEVAIDIWLARRLVSSQFPELAAMPVSEIPEAGTSNVTYRLGEELCIRLPRLDDRGLLEERQWLPLLAPLLPLAIPELVAAGEPTAEYPFAWSIQRWIEGDTYANGTADDERRTAADLGAFVRALRSIDLSDGTASGRAQPSALDATTREAIRACRGVLDLRAITAAWERALESPPWDGVPLWRHCDLLPSNLLVRDGRLTAVIDFGGVGVGDPALDVVPAWSVFSGTGRAVFRRELGIDDGTWERARGYALHQALLIIPYYRNTNPSFMRSALLTTTRILDEKA